MITVTDETEILTPHVLVVENPPAPVHVRPFDANRGDQRTFTQDEAIAVARLRVKDRGCRQQVRQVDRPHDDDHLIPRWLIQDI